MANQKSMKRGGGQPLPAVANNREAYVYVRKKYEKFLEELPTYKGSGETPRLFWWCWLQGIENAPPVCKACLNSLKKHYPDYGINILSLKNINQAVQFPEHIVKKFNEGKISPTHFSDLLRLELLINYGGIWADSTVFATAREPYYLHYPLFIFQGFWRGNDAHLGSNWFIVGEKNNPILKTTRDLLYKFWEDHDKLGEGAWYFIFHLMFKFAAEKYPQIWNRMPLFSNIPPHILQLDFFKPFSFERFEQIKSMSNFHKLSWKYPPEIFSSPQFKGTFADYVLNAT